MRNIYVPGKQKKQNCGGYPYTNGKQCTKIHVHVQLIHITVQQKLTQRCKATTLQ